MTTRAPSQWKAFPGRGLPRVLGYGQCAAYTHDPGQRRLPGPAGGSVAGMPDAHDCGVRATLPSVPGSRGVWGHATQTGVLGGRSGGTPDLTVLGMPCGCSPAVFTDWSNFWATSPLNPFG